MSLSRSDQQALAQMIHQSHISSWLVRTIGVAIGASFLVGFLVALVFADENPIVAYALGAFSGSVAFILILVLNRAPMPSDGVMEFLGFDADDHEDVEFVAE